MVLCRIRAAVWWMASRGMLDLQGKGPVQVIEVGPAHVHRDRATAGREQASQVGRRVRAGNAQLAVDVAGPAGGGPLAGPRPPAPRMGAPRPHPAARGPARTPPRAREPEAPWSHDP